MVFCRQCKDEVEAEVDEAGGFASCPMCGLILEDVAFSSDVQFAKGADGEGELVGQFVSESGQVRGLGRMAGGRLWGARGDSHDIAVNKGRGEIQSMIDTFNIRPREDCLEAAHRLYRLALQQGFTKGRRVNQVAAACLYIICRQEEKPFMLIDYSDLLQVNVFSLGAVYIQLLRLLRLEDHPTFAKPADPSLFLHRFCAQLDLGREGDPCDDSEASRAALTSSVTNTAMRLISSMKRDWMQTGRRPSGVCGAALFLACHIHGAVRSKRDIMKIVHVGWSTLDERVREFRATAVSALTAGEFEEVARTADADEARLLAQLRSDPEASSTHRDHKCVHVEGGVKHFAHGMCQECFLNFMRVSGGIWASSADPPAFARAEAARAYEAAAAARAPSASAPGGELEAPPPRLALPAPRRAGLVVLEGPGAAGEARNAAIAAGDLLPWEDEEAGEAAGPGARPPRAARSRQLDHEVAEEVGRLESSLVDMQDFYTHGGTVQLKQGAQEGGSGEAGSAPRREFGASLLGYGAAGAAPPRRAARGSQPGPATQEAPAPLRPAVEASQRPAPAAAAAGMEAQLQSTRRRRRSGACGGEGEGEGAGGSDDEECEGRGGEAAAAAEEEEEEEEGRGARQQRGPVPESLSDLDDEEIDCYIATAEEARRRALFWNSMNRDWVAEQRSKQDRQQEGAAAAAAAAAAARQVDSEGEEEEQGGVAASAAFGGLEEAAVLPSTGTAAVAAAADQARRGPPARRPAKRVKPAQLGEAETAADAARAMLRTKKLSDKINYKTLESLFDSAAAAAAAAGGVVGGGQQQQQQQQQQQALLGGPASVTSPRLDQPSAAAGSGLRPRGARAAAGKQLGGGDGSDSDARAGFEAEKRTNGAPTAAPAAASGKTDAKGAKRGGSIAARRLAGLGSRRK